MIFIVNLEKLFHKRGWLASIDLEGADEKTISVYWEQLKLPLVKQLVKNQEIVADIREMGFKYLKMSDGKVEWNIDLKN